MASQNLELTNIGHYEQDSIITPYGTDGNSLYELFAKPDSSLPKRLYTKSLRGSGPGYITLKNFKRIYAELHDNSNPSVGMSLTGTVTTSDGGVPTGSEGVGFEVVPGKLDYMDAQGLAGGGIGASLELNSLSPDFTIERLHISSEDRTLYGA